MNCKNLLTKLIHVAY